MTEDRVKNLMCSGFRKFESYPEDTQKLKDGMYVTQGNIVSSFNFDLDYDLYPRFPTPILASSFKSIVSNFEFDLDYDLYPRFPSPYSCELVQVNCFAL